MSQEPKNVLSQGYRAIRRDQGCSRAIRLSLPPSVVPASVVPASVVLAMVVLAMLGRLPGVFVSCWFGAYATELPAWAWIPLVGGTAGLALLFVRYQRQIEALALRVIRRLTGSHSSETPPVHSEAEGHRSGPD